MKGSALLTAMTILMASSAAAAIMRLQYLDQRLGEYVAGRIVQ